MYRLNKQPILFVNFDETLPVFQNWDSSERLIMQNSALNQWMADIEKLAVKVKIGPPAIVVIDPFRGSKDTSPGGILANYDKIVKELFANPALTAAVRPVVEHMIANKDKGIVGMQAENVIMINSQLAYQQLDNMRTQYLIPILIHEITHALEEKKFGNCLWYRTEARFSPMPQAFLRAITLADSGLETLADISPQTKAFLVHCVNAQKNNPAGEEHFTTLVEALTAFALGICPAEQNAPGVTQALTILQQKVLTLLDFAKKHNI